MSLLGATILTGVATAVLAVGALVTAVLAYLAFRKQAREVAAIERQVSDGQELARQQAELLKVQSGQLELQREQLADQRKATAAQAEVLVLQAAELRESLEERRRESERRRRAQASRVFITQKDDPLLAAFAEKPVPTYITAHAVNTSDQPIYDAEFVWMYGSTLQGEPNPDPLQVIMPDDKAIRTRQFPLGTNMDGSGAILRFTDAAGIRWVRRPDGYLGEQL